jgi:hypothetical protein
MLPRPNRGSMIMRARCRKYLTSAGLLLLILWLPACQTLSAGPKVAIPAACNRLLGRVAHAKAAEGADPKLAWIAERTQLERANRRIAAGGQCWQRTVDTYARGG